MKRKTWIIVGLSVGFLLMSCTVCIAVIGTAVNEADQVWERAEKQVRETKVYQCHYDANLNMSVVLSGTAGNSRSNTYSGNVCN